LLFLFVINNKHDLYNQNFSVFFKKGINFHKK
jgi:hypothetical protein